MEHGVSRELADADLDRSVDRQLADLMGHQGLVEVGEVATGAPGVLDMLGQVVDPDHHVLGGGHDRSAGRR